MRRLTLFSLILVFLLAGCNGGAVIFAPTPLPPDLTPVTVQHPGGAFSIAVPPDWSAYTQDNGAVVSMSFSPPNYDAPVLTAAVIRLANPPQDPAMLASDYQMLHRPDVRRYIETARELQNDGSWRFGGVRTLSNGEQIALNTFLQTEGTFVSVVEAVVTQDSAIRESLEIAVNTFHVNTDVELPAAELSALSFVNTASLEIQNSAAWSNRTGVLFITGEIANHTGSAIADVPVRVSLLDENGNTLLEASDMAMGYQIAAGGFAPFSLRFGQGQPVDAVGFKVTMGDQPTNPPGEDILGAPVLQWTDEPLFTPEGHLLVSGTVTNTGNRTAYDPVTLVTVFDGSGDVIGAWYQATTAREIPPGESIDYEVRVLEIGGGARNYIVDIQAKTD